MSNLKLKDRIAVYEDVSTFKLMPKLPVIIRVNGRSFSKLTSLMDKPFSIPFAECMYSTLIRLTQEIDGSFFGYSFNDEIIIISRNDQSHETALWYDGNIQKIASSVASIATLQFNNLCNTNDLNLLGDPLFTATAFTVPSITEAINVMVSKQQQASQSAVQFACLYELLKKYDKNDIKDMLSGTSYDDKINLLNQEFGIDFNEYPAAFRRGVACYRTPTVVNYEGEEKIKGKWKLNTDIPIFTKEHSFLAQIFKTGSDIFRKESL